MDNRRYDRRVKRERPEKTYKTEHEKQRSHEEVQQIKKNLINFARTEWGKQWIHSILKIGRPYRMQRGIDYAKDEDRIDNLTINKGQIFATVQGTAPTPYRVKILFETISEEVWKVIIKELALKSINLIKLLEGELPEEINTIFSNANFPLFLDVSQGLNATCSCPDQAIPCKHIASVILYIARVLDFNPFILLKLRGKTKNEILSDLSISKIDFDEEIRDEDENSVFSFNIPKISIQEIQGKKQSTADIHIGFKFKKPGKIIETLENLGLPYNLENPKAFTTVLGSVYRSVSTYVYKMAMNIENPQKDKNN